jgi:hypothetical protein
MEWVSLASLKLIAGIATTLAAIVLYSYSVARDVETHRRLEEIPISVTGFLIVFAVLVVPGILVGVGAYGHSIKQSMRGLWCLLMGTILNCAIIVMYFVALVWAFPRWAGLLFIMEFFLPLIAVAAAFFSHRNPTSA